MNCHWYTRSLRYDYFFSRNQHNKKLEHMFSDRLNLTLYHHSFIKGKLGYQTEKCLISWQKYIMSHKLYYFWHPKIDACFENRIVDGDMQIWHYNGRFIEQDKSSPQKVVVWWKWQWIEWHKFKNLMLLEITLNTEAKRKCIE